MFMPVRKTMRRRVVMERFIVKHATSTQGQALFKLSLAKSAPLRIMQASHHKSSVIDAHPLHRRLIFIARMVVRHPIGIDGCALEERRIISPGNIGPNEFIKEDHPHTERLNLGDGRY